MADFVFHMIGNAHLDPVWLWDGREGLNEGLVTCRTILDLMDEDGDLTFSRGESSIYEHIERTDPAMFARIAAYVKQGRWDVVGGSYVQSDHNLPDTESLLRQYTRGQQYFLSRFGKPALVAWAADCFGHSAGLPEIFHAAGCRYFTFTRPFESTLPLPKPAFWWVGPAGSRILSYRSFGKWYGTDRHETVDRFNSSLEKAKTHGLHNVGIFYGLGNHGGGPTRRQLAEIRQWAAENPNIQVVHSTMHRFFHELEKEVASKPADFLPTFKGELNFTLRGCYSSVSRLKYAHRQAQSQLLAAESADAVIAAQCDRAPADLTRPWASVLFNCFHDILPGTSIERATDDQVSQIHQAFSDAQSVEFHALNALSQRIDTRVAPAEHIDMPTAASLMVWNPHPYPFDGYVELEACLDWRPIEQYRYRVDELPVRLLDAQGRARPFQCVKIDSNFAPWVPWRKRVVTPVKLPAMGWSMMQLGWVESAGRPAAPATLQAGAYAERGSIHNAFYHIDTHCGATGVRIRYKGKPLFAGDGLTAAVFDDPHSSWTTPNDSTLGGPFPLLETMKVTDIRTLETGPWRASLWVRLSGERSRIDLTFQLCGEQDRIEVIARVFWNESTARLKLLMPLGGKPSPEYEVPGGSLRRNVVGQVPVCRWARLRCDDGSQLGFVSDCLSDFDCTDDEFRATVVRSSRYAFSGDINEDQPWLPPSDKGELKFRMVLTGQADANLPRIAQQLAQPPVVTLVSAKDGPLPREDSLMQIRPDNLRLLAFKPAGDGKGYIIRLQETAGQSADAQVTLLGKPVSLGPVIAYELATWRLQISGETITARRCDAAEQPMPA